MSYESYLLPDEVIDTFLSSVEVFWKITAKSDYYHKL